MPPIYVACPNLSLDRTMLVDSLRLGWVHRATETDVRGGGKGVNIARALKNTDTPARIAGIAGGHTGSAVIGLLSDEGFDVTITECAGETRSCLTVLAGEQTTVFNEAGPHIDVETWDRFETAVAEWLAPESVFVCSGSWPQGSPPNAAARLITIAMAMKCVTICDTSGEQLSLGLAAHPDVVKPNLSEAREVLYGISDESVVSSGGLDSAGAAAKALLDRGPKAVVVSAGAAGVALAGDNGVELIHSPEVSVVNPIGAGDALVAGIADGLAAGRGLAEAVRWGTAMAAASCETFVAGLLETARAEELYAKSTAT
jgi:tagatose 6-phosphate kinase